MSELKAYTCPSCSGPLDFEDAAHNSIRCSYCGSSLSLPASMQAPNIEEKTEHFLLDQVGVLQRIGKLVRDGQKIEAIKLYREKFHVDLQEAKGVIDQIASGKPFSIYNTSAETSTARHSTLSTNSSINLKRKTKKPRNGKRVLTTLFFLVALGILAIFVGGEMLDAFSPEIVDAVVEDVQEIIGDVIPLDSNQPVLTFGGQGIGPGLFSDARNIGVDGDGNYYISDYETGIIQVFNALGEYQHQWSVDEEVNALSLDTARDGSVFVVTSLAILKYEGASGTLLAEYSTPNVFSFDDIAITVEGVAVVSYHQGAEDSVLRIELDGLQTLVGESIINNITGDAELSPIVAVDGLGDIYVLGIFNSTVVKISSTGQFLNRFGSEGDEPGQFTSPASITVDGRGNIYIGDFDGVMVYDNSGRYIETIEITSFPRDLLVNDDNQLVVLSIDQSVNVYNLQD